METTVAPKPLSHLVKIAAASLTANAQVAPASPTFAPTQRILFRVVLGAVLRARRQEAARTLREVSRAAQVSLGYLSEIERGQKEASSELIGSVCRALGVTQSQIFNDVATQMALAEMATDLASTSQMS
jgi:DNA-binding XRE family transcriptional regulator